MVSKCYFSTMMLCVLCTACHCVAFLCMYDVKYTLCTTSCLPMYHCVVLTWRHAAPLGVIPWCRRPLGACPSQYVSAVFLYAVREGIYRKKEKNVFFRALSKFPEPPIQAIWSLYLDVTKYVLAPITERSTNDDYYGSDEKLPKTYQYYDF